MTTKKTVLQQQLEEIRKNKSSSYNVRTEHYNNDGSVKYTNRLIQENSPYLLQHAHNPVNWYPWSEEAFATAKKLNKPIFLSIGYSTCHWCHVMEEESFDNEAVAALLNKWFISIKVDREQRPDIDEIYMTGVQIFSGRGGWPMSSFLTPEGEPFFGGTYFPAEHFKKLLTQVSTIWSEDEKATRQRAAEVSQKIDRYLSSSSSIEKLDMSLLQQWSSQMLSEYDDFDGGFSKAPKFPNETQLLFFLDQLKRGSPDDAILQAAVDHTLDRMAQGGLYDQIGGGFHRYSTDNEWLAPHFEKMLYNQALLGRVYAESYFLTASRYHRQIARETFDYVLRDMTAASGGFYSATDADSEGEEGTFFLWSVQQLKSALSEEDFQLIQALYSVTEAGNFEGSNILHLDNLPKVYNSKNVDDESLRKWQENLRRIKQILYQEREKRIHPFRDKKIITAWNGMMITALAKSATFLQEPRYLHAATKAANYLWDRHFDTHSGLVRVSLEGATSIPATQEDYAYFAEAMLALYDNAIATNPSVINRSRKTNTAKNTLAKVWLSRAELLMDEMIKLFFDEEAGGFYLSSSQTSGPMISRIKSTVDGAIPSGNSVALSALVSLVQHSENISTRQILKQTLAFFSGDIKQQGSAYTYAMLAVAKSIDGEVAPNITLSNGRVSAIARWVDESNENFEVKIKIKPGWHINADTVLQKSLIPTAIGIKGANANQVKLHVDYPSADSISVTFSKQKLLLFNGSIVIKGRLEGNLQQPPKITLKLQTCSNTRCLLPEERVLLLQAR